METRSNGIKNYGRIKKNTLNHREGEEVTNWRRRDVSKEGLAVS